MKKNMAILIIFILVITMPAAVLAAEGVDILIENNIVTVTNAPENSTLITAFYKNNALFAVKLHKGSETITADISQEKTNADVTKLFLWDM